MFNKFETDWELILRAWMHDPVDKALSIQNHESRAGHYLSVALNDESFSINQFKSVKSADINASTADRLPMPKAGVKGERAVGPKDGPIKVYHPISAQKHQLAEYEIDMNGVAEVINGIVRGLPSSPKIRFLALWRLLPDALNKRFGFDFTRLPADTRVPDHSLIQHVDITSGLMAAQQQKHGYAILSVKIGPVQKFIQDARSVRDLWSGSAILSWLMFQGMRPIIDSLGPTVFVFPALRRNPLVDIWLRSLSDELNQLINLPSLQTRKAPSLPNSFVALVPNGRDGKTALEFTRQCETRIRSKWREMSNTVLERLDKEFSNYDPNWALNWNAQIDSFLEITTSICPTHKLHDMEMASLIGDKKTFGEVWKDAHLVRQMGNDIPSEDAPMFRQVSAGQWQAQLEVSSRIAEAQRTVRHIPQVSLTRPAGPKCSLMGTYEQVGPANLQESADFWADIWEHKWEFQYRIRKPDRLCAVALCKRFAPDLVLKNQFKLDESSVPFPDTATIAAQHWMDDYNITTKSEKIWNGRWIHQKRPDENGESAPEELWSQIKKTKKDSTPPSYYAVLVMDADDMGLWLKGEKAPLVREVMHEKLIHYFEQLKSNGLEAKRPLHPALHSSISEALNNFASVVVPNTVERFKGTLIYSGGDDVLTLLPTRNAVQCAFELQRAFIGQNDRYPGWTEIEGQQFLMMGSKATLSAGIAFVHYKEDLRLALQAGRDAEGKSKSVEGKNSLTLHFMRRSGDHPTSVISWNLVPWFQQAVKTFSEDISDRWLYQLRRESHVLSDPNLPPDAVSAEIKRLLSRSDVSDDVFTFEGKTWWSYFCDQEHEVNKRLQKFIELCLGASFVARGYDA